MVRFASILFGAAGLVSGQHWTLNYYTDGNCTVAANMGIDGPLDACVNTTAHGSGVFGPYYKSAIISGCNEGANYTMRVNTVEAACPTTGLSPVPVNAAACTFSTTFNMYYLATCSNSVAYSGNAATFTITTTHAPISQGMFAMQYYNEANCTTEYSVNGVLYGLAGPLGQCINATATGSPLSAGYKATETWNCDGTKFTMNAGVLGGNDCAASNLMAFPVTVGACTFSSSTGKWYVASCNSTAWTDSTIVITTTHAPIDQGTFHIKYYTDNACTNPHNISGLQTEIGGPMGGCVNTSMTSSALQGFYKVTEVDQCNGAQYTMKVGQSYDCAAATAFPVVVGQCTWSTSLQQYYFAACNSTTWSGATITFTTTPANAIGQGSFTLKYYTNNNCTTKWQISNASVELAGPIDGCVNMSATGSPLAANYAGARISNCHSTNYTMEVNLAAASCASGLQAFPVMVGTCTYSASTTMYYMATCDTSAPWTNAAVTVPPPATTTVAPTTTAAASTETTVAATTVASTSETTETTAAPKIQASYEATEDLPASTTAADLLASTVYVDAKKTGIAQALSVAVAKVTIDGFAISSRRLANKGRRLASKTVVTEYSVEVTAATLAAKQTLIQSPSIAASIQTETTTAMQAADWSNESVLTAAPTVTVTSSTFVGTVAPAAAATPTSTSFAMNLGSLSMLAGAFAAMFMLL